MPLSDAALGRIVRTALAAEGLVIKRQRPLRPAPDPVAVTARQEERTAKHSGITVDRLHGRSAWMRGDGQLEPCDQDNTKSCEQYMLGWQEMEDVRKQFPDGERCHCSRDGEVCNFDQCPQERDNESHSTGRHCPLDRENMRAEREEA